MDEIRDQYLKRFRSAFGSEWTKLTPELKKTVVEKLLEIEGLSSYQDEGQIRETLQNISNKRIGFGMLLLGVLLGVLGSLIASIFEKYVSSLTGPVYDIFIPVVFFVLIWKCARFFEEETNGEYRANNLLQSILELIKAKE